MFDSMKQIDAADALPLGPALPRVGIDRAAWGDTPDTKRSYSKMDGVRDYFGGKPAPAYRSVHIGAYKGGAQPILHKPEVKTGAAPEIDPEMEAVLRKLFEMRGDLYRMVNESKVQQYERQVIYGLASAIGDGFKRLKDAAEARSRSLAASGQSLICSSEPSRHGLGKTEDTFRNVHRRDGKVVAVEATFGPSVIPESLGGTNIENGAVWLHVRTGEHWEWDGGLWEYRGGTGVERPVMQGDGSLALTPEQERAQRHVCTQVTWQNGQVAYVTARCEPSQLPEALVGAGSRIADGAVWEDMETGAAWEFRRGLWLNCRAPDKPPVTSQK